MIRGPDLLFEIAAQDAAKAFRDMPDVTVNTATTYQTFLGWQASGETGISDYIASGLSYNSAALDAGVGLGIN